MLFELPTWLIISGFCVLLITANEIGFRVGCRHRDQETELTRSVSNSLKGSIFGLVALLLGFSFSATTNRHDMRQRIVLDQANAIGTCYQRAGLLDEATRNQIHQVLARYLDARYAQYTHGDTLEDFEVNQAAINQSLNGLWSAVEAANRQSPDAVRNSLIIPAANEVIDLGSTRSWANRNHLPTSVLILLLSSVLVSAALLGHSSGQSGKRHVGLWLASNLVFGLVLFIVLDFDRPRSGLILVDPVPLLEVRESMFDNILNDENVTRSEGLKR